MWKPQDKITGHPASKLDTDNVRNLKMEIRVKTVESVKDGDIDSTEGRVGGFVGLADRIPRLRKTTPPATPPPPFHTLPRRLLYRDAC